MILTIFCLTALAQPQELSYPPLRKCRLDSSLKIAVGKAKWSVDCYRCDSADTVHYVSDNFAIIRKQGMEIARCAPWESPCIGAYRVRIDAGCPVFAVRSQYGLGVHWDTVLFAIRHGKLIKMGRPPAMNSNGPIVWHGNRKIWAFDNYDSYGDRFDPKFRFARVLMKVGPDGKLHKGRTIWTEHPRIPTTVMMPDDDLATREGW